MNLKAGKDARTPNARPRCSQEEHGQGEHLKLRVPEQAPGEGMGPARLRAPMGGFRRSYVPDRGGNPRDWGRQGGGKPSFPEPLMCRRSLGGPAVLSSRAEGSSPSTLSTLGATTAHAHEWPILSLLVSHKQNPVGSEPGSKPKQTSSAGKRGRGGGRGYLAFSSCAISKTHIGATSGFAQGRVGEQLAAVISSGDKGMPRPRITGKHTTIVMKMRG